jgi:hypothetical protein
MYNLLHHIPTTPSELGDQLMHMVGVAPSFKSDMVRFELRSIDSEYDTVQKGLDNIRKKIGEEKYKTLVEMAAVTRAIFEANAADLPEQNPEIVKGCHLLQDMIEILEKRSRRK